MTVAAAADEHQQALGDDGAAMKELEAQQPSYRSLAAPVTNPVDKFALLPAFLKVRGLVKEHIDSFNYFITMGIRKIIEANNRIEARNDPNIYLKYVLSVLFYSVHSFHSDTTALQQSSIQLP
jgi:DNA-directed RNA polymerase III subunit RPC2